MPRHAIGTGMTGAATDRDIGIGGLALAIIGAVGGMARRGGSIRRRAAITADTLNGASVAIGPTIRRQTCIWDMMAAIIAAAAPIGNAAPMR